MANNNKVEDVSSLDSFKKITLVPNRLCAIHFHAPWATQCTSMDEAMLILAGEDNYKEVTFARVEAEEQPEISMDYDVAAVPTLLFMEGGKVLDRIEGAKVADMTLKVRELADKVALKAKSAPLTAAKADRDFKKLINAAPAMLFMKGSPSAPECKFSRATVELLGSVNAEYGHFDILRDDEVRQGLKEFSNWPTFPQFYVNGDLIGGLDILKEMQENGELESTVPKKMKLDDRLKKLINQHSVMVFMKGDPATPKCGFSRQLMAILQEIKADFKTFDILRDDEVRQGLKTFSNWPTYPQVYVGGELVGGLDIINELKESGDLESTLKGE